MRKIIIGETYCTVKMRRKICLEISRKLDKSYSPGSESRLHERRRRDSFWKTVDPSVPLRYFQRSHVLVAKYSSLQQARRNSRPRIRKLQLTFGCEVREFAGIRPARGMRDLVLRLGSAPSSVARFIMYTSISGSRARSKSAAFCSLDYAAELHKREIQRDESIRPRAGSDGVSFPSSR